MKQRVITGVLLGFLVLWGLLGSSDFWFGVIVFAVVLLSANEWFQFVGLKSLFHRLIYMLVIASGVVLSLYFPLVTLWVSAAFWLCALWYLSRYSKVPVERLLPDRVKYVMGVFVIVPLWVSLYWLHGYSVPMLIMLILVIAMGDSGAYFAGRTMGKTKLAPVLSPKKTVEGLIGGVLLGGLTAFIFADFIADSLQGYLLLAALMTFMVLVAVVGDIFESMIKRSCGIKDSGRILPGHGGILDRIDSLFPAVPIFVLVAYYLGLLN